MSDVVTNTICPEDIPKESRKSIYGKVDDTSNLNRLHDDSFDTILDLPKCLKNYNRKNNDPKKEISLSSLELNVRNFPIPELNIGASKIAYGVGSVTESGNKYQDFGDITIQFKVNDTMSNYWTLYKWLNMLIDLEKGVGGGFSQNEISTTYSVFMLQQYKTPIGLWNFHGVTPVNLGGFNLTNNSNGEDLFIDFTFAFDYFTFDLRDDID